MRKSIFSLLGMVLLILVSKSCEKNNATEEENITSADINVIKNTVMSGDWSIAHYFDSEIDKTADYEGYTFSFNADGTLATTNGNSSLSGAWSITSSDDGDEDNNSDDVDFNIFFSSLEIFTEISEDWTIKKYTETKIELMKTGGENGGTNLLTFEKL